MVYKLCPELQLVKSVQSFLSEKTADKNYLSLKSFFPNPALLLHNWNHSGLERVSSDVL